MASQLKFRQEFRNKEGGTGALWVRIGGGWYSIVDGKKKYEELPVSLGVRVSTTGRITDTTAKLKLARLEMVINELKAESAAKKRQISKDEVKMRLAAEDIGNIRTVPVISIEQAKIDATISKVIGQYIEEKSQHVSDNYLKIYRTLQYYFERYDRQHAEALTFSSFDRETYKAFWAWQNDVYSGRIEIERGGKGKGRTDADGFSADSLRKYQKAFYCVADFAQHLGITIALQNTKYERSLLIKPKAMNVDPKFYLTVEDIKKIIDYVPTSKALETARQFLVISCLTGQRFETMQTLDRTQIVPHKDGFSYAGVYYNKTKVSVVLPLFPQVLKELKNGVFPSFESNVVINRDIKRVCQLAGISRWSEVTTHTGKRSFYTNLADAGVPPTIIELITHPKRRETAMQSVYDTRQAMPRAEQFFKYLKTVDTPDLYSFNPVCEPVNKVVEIYEYH